MTTAATTGYRHCMHEESYQTGLTSRVPYRYCCWCPLRQQQVQDMLIHGPNYPGERYRYHWSPPSNLDDCPRNMVEGRIVLVTTERIGG